MDPAENQSSVEWAEFSGAGVFEIVLAALLAVFTAGAGNVAQATSQLRHASRLRGLGQLFRSLARQLRRKKLQKTIDVPVDQRTTTSTDQPALINLRAKGERQISPRERIRELSDEDIQRIGTSETFVTRGGGEQIVVPDRGQFSTPQRTGSVTDN